MYISIAINPFLLYCYYIDPPKASMSTERNFYEILNASATATADELKSNYKQLILQCHPDKLLQHQQQQQQQQTIEVDLKKLEINDPNNVEFVAITEAWQCLKDPSKRKQYDAELLLNKFHTHNNIYAHIKLAEMKKQLNTEDYEDYCDEVLLVNEAAAGEEEGTLNEEGVKEKECSTTKYLYTYDCRCGGQYIVDESAEQYCCRTSNHHHGSDVKTKNNDNNVDCFNGVEDDDADDNNITQNNNSPNNTKKCKNDGGAGAGGGGGGVTAAAAASDGGSEGIVFNEDNEEGGELIVECSECSLVIILNG